MEARRRNPRSRTTRLLLLDRFLRTNRIDEAGVEVAALTRLMTRAAEVLTPELARMAKDPKTAPALTRMLRRDPGMHQAVLANLATTGADPDLILKLAAAGPRSAPSATGLQWQNVLLARLVEKGDAARAYALWRSFTGLPADPGPKSLYDPAFAGLPGPGPFNWELTSTGDGVAERVAGPALQVDYYGRTAGVLARQLVMLRPGAYRLQFRAEGDAKGEGTLLQWVVACQAGDRALLTLPLKDVNSSPRNVGAAFTVPAGCAAQWVRLEGISGDVPAEQVVTIRDMRLAAGGGK